MDLVPLGGLEAPKKHRMRRFIYFSRINLPFLLLSRYKPQPLPPSRPQSPETQRRVIEDIRAADPPVDLSELTEKNRTRYAYYLASGIDVTQLPDLDQAMLQQSSPEDYTPRYAFI